MCISSLTLTHSDFLSPRDALIKSDERVYSSLALDGKSRGMLFCRCNSTETDFFGPQQAIICKMMCHF